MIMGSRKWESCLWCLMSAQIRAERSQTNKLWIAQAGSRQHRPSRSCLEVAVGHTDDPACVPPGKPGAEAMEGPRSHWGGSKLPLLLRDAEDVCADGCWRGCAGSFLQLQDSLLKQPTGRKAVGCGQKEGGGLKVEGQTGSIRGGDTTGRMGCSRGEGAWGKANTGTGKAVRLH